jgi:hypothetical protein
MTLRLVADSARSLVTIRRGRLDDLRDEVVALADEGRDWATATIHLVRLAQLQLAAGRSPATVLAEIERRALRHQTAMTSAGAHARADRSCPDAEEPAVGHGEAA